MYSVLLLRDPAGRSELKLSRAQEQSVDELIKEVEYPLFLLRDVPAKDRDVKLLPIQKILDEKLATALTQPQRARLSQIVFQARGFSGIVSPETVTRLRLSSSQVERIKKISESANRAAATTGAADAVPAAQDDSEQQNAPLTRQRAYEAIAAVLDDRQRTSLAALSGPGFDSSGVKWVATTAPELQNVATWINSEPIKLQDLHGKVVVVHFWAFGCVNCIHNLPHYQKWHAKFSTDEVTILGIHTPETEAERSAENLQKMVAKFGIKYPVAFDAAADNWRAWANHMWPSVYLVDKQGRVRQWWYGELNWQGGNGEERMCGKIQELIDEK